MFQASGQRAGTLQLASRSAFISGVVATVGLALWFARFPFPNGPVGWLNDLLVLIQYVLALPVAVALHQLFRRRYPRLSLTAFVIGVTGMLALMFIQLLLVIRAQTFAQLAVPDTVAILVVGIWLLITGYLGSSTGLLQRGLVMSLLAVPYFGYPVWAFWLSRALRSLPAD